MRIIFIAAMCISAFVTLAQAQQPELMRGVELYRSGDYIGAVKELEAVSPAKELITQRFLYLGAAYVRLGRDAEAREAFRQAKAESTGKGGLPGEINTKVTYKDRPTFGETMPASAQRAITIMVAELRADGKIGFVFRLSASYDTMFPIAVEATRKMKFKPAISKGKPVTVIRIVEYQTDRK